MRKPRIDRTRHIGSHGQPWLVPIVMGLVIAGAASQVSAQPVRPIGPYVIDARGSLARFKEDPTIAATIDVTPDNLPTRGLGVTAGVHWYPLRWRAITLGIGGEMLLARDSRTGEATETAPERPTVTTRLTAMSPQLSLNFGRREGWSYISGGMGWARLTAERDDLPSPAGVDHSRATNYGAGARWFTSDRVAFSVDVRFYAINARPAFGTVPEFPRNRLTIISAGISVR